MQLFSSVVDVLEYVGENGNDNPQRAEAIDLLDIINRFEFVFVLHLMWRILRITHELSQVLQRKDQDIVNAINLVKASKACLQDMRDNGWDNLFGEVSEFCSKHKIVMLNMEDVYAARGRSRRKVEKATNLHYYRVELFCSVIDKQAIELNDLYELENQLENFLFDVRLDRNFFEVVGIGGLAQKMVATRKHVVFPLFYLLVKLSLILPIATATVERVLSAMKIVKSSLRNQMGDKLLNDCLIAYIEKDVFENISNEAIMQRFQNMKSRKEML